MLDVVQNLCRNITGSNCAMPRMSNWEVVAPGQAGISVDVADAATLGVAAALPVNVKVHGSHFSCGLIDNSAKRGISVPLSGYGTGAGAGVGWGIPFVGGTVTGRMPQSITRKVIETVGSSVQGRFVEWTKSKALGVSGGTRVVSGPAAKGALTIPDFGHSWATCVGLGANFVVNGVSAGLMILAKKRPVMSTEDLVHALGFWLVGSVGMGLALDAEASGIVYRTSIV